MSYVPNNTNVYIAAFQGCMSGLGASGQFLLDSVAGDYAVYAKAADAFAQAVDTAFGLVGPTLLEISLITQISGAVWQGGRSRLPSGQDVLPSAYTGVAAGVVAMAFQGNAQVVSEGINPSAGTQGYGEISLQDSASSVTLTTQNNYYLLNTWAVNQNGQGVTPNASAGTLTILEPGWYQTVCALSVQSANNLTFKGALFVNGNLHQNGKTQWTTSGISGSPIINPTISDVNLYAAGDVLDVRVTCTTGGPVVITPLQANFYVVQVG